jgi:hypothetical protein
MRATVIHPCNGIVYLYVECIGSRLIDRVKRPVSACFWHHRTKMYPLVFPLCQTSPGEREGSSKGRPAGASPQALVLPADSYAA